MHQAITHLSFADWVIFIFDHPAEGPDRMRLAEPDRDAPARVGLRHEAASGGSGGVPAASSSFSKPRTSGN